MHEEPKKPARVATLDMNGSQDTISSRLRHYYDAVKEETIPDRFLDLLERLDEADRAFATKKADGNGSIHD